MEKNILLIGNHPPPFGGVPTHIRYLAPYLVSKGWNVFVLSFAGNRKWRVKPKEFYDGYQVIRPTKIDKWLNLLLPRDSVPNIGRFKYLIAENPRDFIRYISMMKFIKRIVTSENIQLVSAYHVNVGFYAGVVCEDLSIPLITTVFGEIYSEIEYFRKRIQEIQFVCKVSRKILSCSQHCANSFKILGLDSIVETVYYGIDTKQFLPNLDCSSIRKRYQIDKKDQVVIFVGRLVREMGLHVLIEAIPMVLEFKKTAKFFIIGQTGELLIDASLLEERYPKNVFVIPDLPNEELPLYYTASTISVVPSINERACLGLAAAEAMAIGKPVIMSDVGGGPEIVLDRETGILIPPKNSSLLADAIIELLGKENELRLMGINGRKRVESMFDKDKTNQRMEQIFLEALS